MENANKNMILIFTIIIIAIILIAIFYLNIEGDDLFGTTLHKSISKVSDY